MRDKVTTVSLQQMKQQEEKITMLTAYDYPTAKALEQAEIDIMLVGDSLGMVVLGYEDTLKVTVEDMIHHTKAVSRGAEKSLVVTDMPFMSYKTGEVSQTVNQAGRIIKESGAEAIKVEGGREISDEIKGLIKADIPVMGHLGLTPQAVNQLGGFKVQGRDSDAAKDLIADAKALTQAGVFAIVLECIPTALAGQITEEISVPTIGIGSGRKCDGQVLVTQDMLGLMADFTPQFVREYANLEQQIISAVKEYKEDVRRGEFPSTTESFE
ncbi:MAG: 3-methyl-2-oxobutanoate hydroxymethyltransferase [Bacillota bacterium]